MSLPNRPQFRVIDADARVIFDLGENFALPLTLGADRRLNQHGKDDLKGEIKTLLALVTKQGLKVSMAMLGQKLGYLDNLPQTVSEFDLVTDMLMFELSSRLFLFVPGFDN